MFSTLFSIFFFLEISKHLKPDKQSVLSFCLGKGHRIHEMCEQFLRNLDCRPWLYNVVKLFRDLTLAGLGLWVCWLTYFESVRILRVLGCLQLMNTLNAGHLEDNFNKGQSNFHV